MYLQEILEVAVGLVFVWLVISIATMSFQEWINTIVNLRAKNLKTAIVQMLGSKNLTRLFYEYPLITNLYFRANKRSKKTRLPSYIPPDKFAATLFELVVQAGTDSNPVQEITKEVEKQLATIEGPEGKDHAREEWDSILITARNVTSSGLGIAALDTLKLQLQIYSEKYPEIKPTIDRLLLQLDEYYREFAEKQSSGSLSEPDAGLSLRQFNLGRLALEKTNPRLGESITAIARQSEGYGLTGEQAVAATRLNLESWFNDAMDRLSSEYKHHAQLVSFIIGIILALFFNVDTIHIATSLWREPILRQAIIAQVASYTPPASSQEGSVLPPLESIPALQIQLQALNIPFGWTTTPFKTNGRICSLLPFQKGKAWGIPSQDDQSQAICLKLVSLPVDVYGWLVKVLGLLITGAAAAQGAPFWFDLLKRLVNVRSTVTNAIEQTPVG
jgi:hypothetical protein